MREVHVARVIVYFLATTVVIFPSLALAIDASPPILSNFVADRTISGYRTFSVDETDTDNLVSCSLYSGSPGTLYGTMTRTVGTNTFSVSNVPVGASTWMWEARCTDSAGNVGTSIKSFTFHTPAVDSISYDMLKAGKRTITATAPDFNYSSSIQESCTVYVDSVNKGSAVETSSNTGVFTNSAIPILAGSRTVKVSCTNVASQTAFKEQTWTFPAPAVGAVTLDSQTPGPRTFSSISPDFNTNSATPQNCTLFVDSVNKGPMIETGNNTNTFSLASVSIAAGSHSAKVSCTDDVGNTGENTLAWTAAEADAESPVVYGISPSGFDPGTKTITAVASDTVDATLDCSMYLNTVLVGVMTKTGATSYARTNVTIAAGQNSTLVQCADDAGNIGKKTYVWVAANETPAGRIESIIVDGGGTGPYTISISAPGFNANTAVAESPCDAEIDGTNVGKLTESSVSSDTYRRSGLTVSSGQHSVHAYCVDSHGGGDEIFKNFTATAAQLPADTQKPVLTNLRVDSTSAGTRTFYVTATDNFDSSDPLLPSQTVCTLTVDGLSKGMMTSNAADHTKYSKGGVAVGNGVHTTSVSCTDDASNVGMASYSWTVEEEQSPPSQTEGGSSASEGAQTVPAYSSTATGGSAGSAQTSANTSLAGNTNKSGTSNPSDVSSDGVSIQGPSVESAAYVETPEQPDIATEPGTPNVPWGWITLGLLMFGGIGAYVLRFLGFLKF